MLIASVQYFPRSERESGPFHRTSQSDTGHVVAAGVTGVGCHHQGMGSGGNLAQQLVAQSVFFENCAVGIVAGTACKEQRKHNWMQKYEKYMSF